MDPEKWLAFPSVKLARDGCSNKAHQSRATWKTPVKVASFSAVALLLCFVHLWYHTSPSCLAKRRIKDMSSESSKEETENKMIFDFSDIVPSEKLQWHPCFNTAKCARLTVPMDYNRPLHASKDNPKVHIALTMIPGVEHNDTGIYSASPLLINPGGPGGSGATFALLLGDILQNIVSTDRAQDVIGFDPRGVGATTPQADCWSISSDRKEPTSEDVRNGAFNRMTWNILGTEIPLVNSTEHSLAQRDSRARALAKLCKSHDNMNGVDSILRHLSTPAVAQDMLSIIDAWDKWRTDTGQVHHHAKPQMKDQKALGERANSFDTAGKLLYWGFSYGSLLGATFAAMFPQKVGRVLLDGVVDADHYVSPIWAESLRDTDRVEESFYHYCRKAGPSCAIYRTNDTEAEIKTRVHNIFLSLKEQPLSGIGLYNDLPFTFNQDGLKMLFFSSLYSPIQAFPWVAQILDACYQRDSHQILQWLPVFYPSYKPFCDTSNSYFYSGQDAQLAIMCTDKRYPLNETLPNLEQRFESIANISHYADVWMSLMVGCDAFDITPADPPMRWDDHPAHRQTPINTAYPLMFLSNSADPVTPLFAGVKMARTFVDAGFLEQRGEGHCSTAAVSGCTLDAISKYFQEGLVPPAPVWGPDGEEVEKGNWKRCEAEGMPWKPFDAETRLGSAEAEWQEEVGRGELEEGEVTRRDRLRVVRMMEDWRDVHDLARSFWEPRHIVGAGQGW